MASLNYSNFDLLIEPAQDGYRARVTRSPAGEVPPTSFQLPETIATTTEQLRLVGGAIRAFQEGSVPDHPDLAPLDPEEFGRQLFTAIFHDDLNIQLRMSVAQAKQQNEGLRIRLFLNDVPELALLPWEYLFDPRDNYFLSLASEMSIVRYLSLPRGVAPLITTLPLRILAVLADIQDGPPQLDLARERSQLEGALKDLLEDGSVTITWLEQATQAELQQTLNQGEYHIFHFIGHGRFNETKGEGGLLFANEQGLGQLMSAKMLGTWLHGHKSLRLAFLNACEGARTAEGQPFGGVAQTLVQRGLPAVIAMQFPITNEAAVILAKEFYNAIAHGSPVDAALTEARKAIYGQSSVMEWGTPVLFMRADDGLLFVLDSTSGAVSPVPVEPIMRDKSEKQAIPRRYFVLSGLFILGILLVALNGESLFPSFWPPTLEPSPIPSVNPPSSETPAARITPATPSSPWVIPAVTATTNPNNPDDTAVYVYIPATTSMMGTTDDELTILATRCPEYVNYNCNKEFGDELSQHKVTVEAFWIMQTEVTNEQYRLCMDKGGCASPPNNPKWNEQNWITDNANLPVAYVTWQQANAYAKWAEGQLPSEAQWELACRGTDGRFYPWGNNDPDPNADTHLANYSWTGSGRPLEPVGSYAAGAYSLFDMAGNVREWTRTIYTGNYDFKSRDAKETDPDQRAVRGGSSYHDQFRLRCANRDGDLPDVQNGSTGFRIVLETQ